MKTISVEFRLILKMTENAKIHLRVCDVVQGQEFSLPIIFYFVHNVTNSKDFMVAQSNHDKLLSRFTLGCDRRKGGHAQPHPQPREDQEGQEIGQETNTYIIPMYFD